MGGKADIVEQALKLVMGAGEEAAPTIRAYHVSPHDFDKFEPSKFRGSTFFSSTPERAKRGAEAGRNEMVFETSTDLPPANWKTYEVEIDPSRIKGLALTPDEHQWFHELPNKIVGDEALAEAVKGVPHGMYWDDFYDHSPVAPNIFEYTKKNKPPSISYEDAIKTGRDVYHRQWPHYNSTATDERAAAESTQNNNMGGYLVNDEGGLSFAIHDPSIIKILNKYSEGGSVREGYGPGGIIDDVVRLAGKVISGEGDEAAQAGIRAYHGSPHDFDKFDMSKIGTGEGAQAYGHGLYFAGEEDIAKWYRDKLSRGTFYDGTRISDMHPSDGPMAAAIHSVSPYIADGDDASEAIAKQWAKWNASAEKFEEVSKTDPARAAKALERAQSFRDVANKLQALDPSKFAKNPGHMYEVNIAADPNAFLDWDKPLSEQIAGQKIIERDLLGPVPPQIEIQAKHGGMDPRELQKSILGEMTGSEILKSEAGNYGGPKSASNRLKEIGIPGIKYLDAGSRGAGDGTRNYVVFDDKLISIIRKYGIAGASAMLGYNLMENLNANQARAATAADMDFQSQKQAKANGGFISDDADRDIESAMMIAGGR